MGRFEPRSLALLYAAGLLLCSLNKDPVTSAPRHQVRCDGCGQSTSGYEIVNYGSIEWGYRQLCSRCFNTEIAKAAGIRARQLRSRVSIRA